MRAKSRVELPAGREVSISSEHSNRESDWIQSRSSFVWILFIPYHFLPQPLSLSIPLTWMKLLPVRSYSLCYFPFPLSHTLRNKLYCSGYAIESQMQPRIPWFVRRAGRSDSRTDFQPFRRKILRKVRVNCQRERVIHSISNVMYYFPSFFSFPLDPRKHRPMTNKQKQRPSTTLTTWLSVCSSSTWIPFISHVPLPLSIQSQNCSSKKSFSSSDPCLQFPHGSSLCQRETFLGNLRIHWCRSVSHFSNFILFIIMIISRTRFRFFLNCSLFPFLLLTPHSFQSFILFSILYPRPFFIPSVDRLKVTYVIPVLSRVESSPGIQRRWREPGRMEGCSGNRKEERYFDAG